MTLLYLTDGGFWSWKGWNAIYTFLTLSIFWVAWRQFKKSNRINEANLYYKLKEEFKNKSIKRILDGCRNNKLIIRSENTPVQETNNTSDYTITSEELQTCFLDNIEDMAYLYEQNLIRLKPINAGFGYWILVAGNDDVIIKHINWLRKDVYNDHKIYEGFENLYKIVRSRLDSNNQKNYRTDFTVADLQ
jgi:hypothetical protein